MPTELFPWTTKSPSPLPDNAIHKVFKENGPDVGITITYALELKSSFGHHTLLGEMMYAYVTCCLDIKYTIMNMSKFSTKPSYLYYSYFKSITKYLHLTKYWGVKYKHTAEHPELYEAQFRPEVILDEKLPS